MAKVSVARIVQPGIVLREARLLLASGAGPLPPPVRSVLTISMNQGDTQAHPSEVGAGSSGQDQGGPREHG